MRYKKPEAWLRLAALMGLCLAVFTIMVYMRFTVLPAAVLLVGFISYRLNPVFALKLFVGLLPLLGASPGLLVSGVPFNYFAIPLFYLSGLLLASFFRREQLCFNYPWSHAYIVFLKLLWISVVFVFLRWSNLTMSHLAWLRDTPVSPHGFRLSFAVIFPILTLFIFSVSPYILLLLRRQGIRQRAVLTAAGWGYLASLAVAALQKLWMPRFLSQSNMRAWLHQANGGFADFNALGFFSGSFFLILVVALVRARTEKHKRNNRLPPVLLVGFMTASLVGTMLSGSRTSLIFIVFAVIFLLFNRRIPGKIRLILVLVPVLLMVFAGGELKTRVQDSFEKLIVHTPGTSLWDRLDKFSNYRITMFRHSWPMISHFPITGVGAGNFLFTLSYVRYGQPMLLDLPLNQFLLVLDEVGIPGLALLLLVLSGLFLGLTVTGERFIFAAIFAALLVGTSLWIPEIAVWFWIIVACSSTTESRSREITRFSRGFTGAVILLVVAFNCLCFQALHPRQWAEEKGTLYDYGFWKWESDDSGTYRWSRAAAGLYLSPRSPFREVEIMSGAPFHVAGFHQQVMRVYWRGEFLRRVAFTGQDTVLIYRADLEGDSGFLEIRVDKTFNPSRYLQTADSRSLGVRVFLRPQENNTR